LQISDLKKLRALFDILKSYIILGEVTLKELQMDKNLLAQTVSANKKVIESLVLHATVSVKNSASMEISRSRFLRRKALLRK
jgi:hypothetical protein